MRAMATATAAARVFMLRLLDADGCPRFLATAGRPTGQRLLAARCQPRRRIGVTQVTVAPDRASRFRVPLVKRRCAGDDVLPLKRPPAAQAQQAASWR